MVGVLKFLLILRLVEVGVMIFTAYSIWGAPPANLVRTRTVIVWLLIFLNLMAVFVSVSWAKITLW